MQEKSGEKIGNGNRKEEETWKKKDLASPSIKYNATAGSALEPKKGKERLTICRMQKDS
jgi:hypothetical protein